MAMWGREMWRFRAADSSGSRRPMHLDTSHCRRGAIRRPLEPTRRQRKTGWSVEEEEEEEEALVVILSHRMMMSANDDVGC
jgi:hypothetical protein